MRVLSQLREQLSDRDLDILRDVERFRLLSTRQIQRLHFTTGHQTASAATRACTRVMGRLRDHGLVSTLSRRVGGVRQGSAGLTWQLAATGDRLLRSLRGDPHRRRFSEPSPDFVEHTLLAAELGVQLREAAYRGDLELTDLSAERGAWRTFLGPHGATAWLRPDLHAVTAGDTYEQHWFIEADRSREHGPHLLRKLEAYASFLRSGRYQATHGLFPTVLWVVPDARRIRELTTLAGQSSAPSEIFQYITTDGFIDHVLTETTGIQSLPLPGILHAEHDDNYQLTRKEDFQQ